MLFSIVRMGRKQEVKREMNKDSSREDNRKQHVAPVARPSGEKLPDWATVTTTAIVCHKPSPPVVPQLAEAEAPANDAADPDDFDPDDFENLPNVADFEPCPKCGQIEFWESLTDIRHCLRCEPRGPSRRLARKAHRLRQQADRQHRRAV